MTIPIPRGFKEIAPERGGGGLKVNIFKEMYELRNASRGANQKSSVWIFSYTKM